MGFEALLARRIAVILASGGLAGLALIGCSGEPSDPDESVCAGDLPKGWTLERGYVRVTAGTDCPDPAGTELSHLDCCPDMIWEGSTCTFEEKWENQIDNSTGYGPRFENAPTGTTGEDICWYEGAFSEGNGCCGRPLLGEDGPVVATPSIGDAAWITDQHPNLAGLGAGLRSAAGLHWLDAALMEHASVASFGRFALELMQLGAPPALVAEAHQAAMQEVTHARLCFGLASAYLGRSVGPGPLDVNSANAPASSLEAFVEAVVREGCVGETLASLEAAARLARTRDPVVREVLATIVRDESSHAALAWKTLRWALDRDVDGRVLTRIQAVFAEEQAKWTAAAPHSPASPALARAHGLLSASERAAVLADAWRIVVGPAWQALAV